MWESKTQMLHSTGKQRTHDVEFWAPGYPVCEGDGHNECSQRKKICY